MKLQSKYSQVGQKLALPLAIIAFAGLAACSNSKNDTAEGSSVKLIKEVVNANQVENTGSAGQNTVPTPTTAPIISNKTKFSSKKYGVAGSPRVAHSTEVRKGGGRYQIGKPYTIRGRRYVPREDPNYDKVGLASWYGPNFHGRLTANGEVYDQFALSAAHPTMPLPSYARVTNMANGASLVVRVNDRGPFARDRIIDLSARAAQMLGYTKKGVAKVRVEYVGKARMDGLDENKLLASYQPGSLNPNLIPPNPGRIQLANASPSTNNDGTNTVAAFAATNPSAPVPIARPSVNVGTPVDVSSLSQRMGASLVDSYSDALESKKFDAVFAQLEKAPLVSPPQMGVADLRRLSFGPIESKVDARSVEDTLVRFGPVSAFTQDGGTMLEVTTAAEEASKIEGIWKIFWKQKNIPLAQ